MSTLGIRPSWAGVIAAHARDDALAQRVVLQLRAAEIASLAFCRLLERWGRGEPEPCTPGRRQAALRRAAERVETALAGLEQPLAQYLLELEADRAEGQSWYGEPGAAELVEWEPVLRRAGVEVRPDRVAQVYLELAVSCVRSTGSPRRCGSASTSTARLCGRACSTCATTCSARRTTTCARSRRSNFEMMRRVQRVPTGIPGLDELTRGGFLAGRTYMVRGGPGVGKTALGLHFLVDGLRSGESAVFITHGATRESVLTDAASIGLDASGIRFIDFTPGSDFFAESQSYDVFAPVDVEREGFVARLIQEIRDVRPARIFLDALTQVRHLSSDLVDFRRQAHAFLNFLGSDGATVVFASGSSDRQTDEDLQFMSDGVINLDYSLALGRTVTVSKLRGSGFRLGQHSAKIDDGGFHVFPRLLPETFGRDVPQEQLASGLEELDEMLNGGVERGSVTLITGPTGVGKTTLATQFLTSAASRGERSVIYTFEETTSLLVRRSEGVSMPLRRLIDEGALSVVEIEPLHYTPDQFALEVRREVEREDARVVLIDSTAGYRLSLQGEDLAAHLHSLCKYLKNMGVTVLLIYEISQITGEFRATDAEVSYLADNILFLRYVEVSGELRRVAGVLKMRTSDFEKTLRELSITAAGVRLGEPLVGFRGILTGLPVPSG